MSDLKKLIEASKHLEVAERFCRHLQPWSEAAQGCLDSLLAAKALMDEAEQKPEWEPGMWAECSGCANHRHVVKFSIQEIREHGWLVESLPPGGIRPHDPSHCRHVPPPKESRAVETSEELFQGPHWDSVRTGRGNCFDVMRECILDLRDELLRMRGGE